MENESSSLLEQRITMLTSAFLLSLLYITEASPYRKVILIAGWCVTYFVILVCTKAKLYYKFGVFYLFLCSFLVSGLVSCVNAINTSSTMETVISILQNIVFLIPLYGYYSKKSNANVLVKTIMWSGYIVSSYVFIYYGVGNILRLLLSSIRLSSEFANSNSVGMIAAISLCITFYYLLYDGFRPYMLFTLLEIIVVLVSGSRKGFVCLILGCVLIYLLKMKSTNALKKIAFILLGCGIAVIAVKYLSTLSVFSLINSRLTGLIALVTGKGIIDHSTLVRQQMIDIGIGLFREHPIIGVGWANSRYYLTGIAGDYAYTHNNYIELLACSGVLGFLSYYGMYFYIIIKLIKYRRCSVDREWNIFFVLCALILFLDYGSVSYYNQASYFFLMALFVYVNRTKSQQFHNR